MAKFLERVDAIAETTGVNDLADFLAQAIAFILFAMLIVPPLVIFKMCKKLVLLLWELVNDSRDEGTEEYACLEHNSQES